MRLLLRDRFDLRSALAGITRPRLLLANSPYDFAPERLAGNEALFRALPDPKMIVTFAKPIATAPATIEPEQVFVRTLSRFLDENVPQ